MKLNQWGDGRRRRGGGGGALVGVLAASAAFACPRLAGAADLTVPSGTYSLNGQTQTFGVVSNTGGALQVGAGTLNAGTLNVSGGSTTVDEGGRINVGAGGLNFSGSPSAPLITLQPGVTPGWIALAGNVSASTPGDTLSPPVIVGGVLDLGGGDRTFDVSSGAALGVTSVIVNGGLVKAGTGILQIAGNAGLQYAGVTRVTGGRLEIGDAFPALEPVPNRIFVLDGGDLAAARFQATWEIVVLQGRIVPILVASGSGIAINVGTFRFSGGSTDIDSNGYIQATTVFVSSGINRCRSIDRPFFPGGPAEGGRLIVGTGGLQLTGEASPTLNVDTGVYPGSLVLGGNVTFTGAAGTAAFVSTAPAAGEFRGKVDLGAAARTFTVGDGSAAVDLRITAEVANGSLVKSGAGLLQLAAPNTYAGGTTINQGTVEVLHPAALGTGPVTIGDGRLSIRSDATAYQTYGNDVGVTGDAHLDAGPVTAGAQVTALQRFGQLTIAAGRTLHADSGTHLLQFDGAVTLPAGAAATFDVTGHLALAAGVTGDAGTTLNKTGPGHLHLQGGTAYAFAGRVNVYAGTLELNHDVGGVVGDLLVTGGALARLSRHQQVRDTATVTLADGTLDLQASSDNVRNLVLAKGTVTGTTGAGTALGVLGGTITATGAAPSTVASDLVLNGVRTVAVTDAAGTLNVTARVGDHGPSGGGIDKTGPGLLVLGGATALAQGIAVDGGTVRVTGSAAATSGVTVDAGGTFDAAGTQSVKLLAVNAGGVAKVSATGGGGGVTVLTVGDNATAGPLALTGTGRLDLGANALVIDYAPGNAAADAAAVALVRGRVVAAYHGGDWLGAGGVGSSVAAADHARAVGYALASDVPGVVGGAFAGKAGVDASSVVARLTLAGDATLDGRVDFNDLVPLAQNYNAAVSGVTESWWARGDFTYDGRVDFDDLVRLAQNYNAALPGEPVPGAAAGFDADLAAAFAAVPEPAGFAGAGTALVCLLARRRRRGMGAGE